MDEQTMYELLEIHDTIDQVYIIQELLTGQTVGAGYGEGILGRLSYVTDIIMRYSRLRRDPGLEFEKTEIGKVLDNKDMDNRRKARIILGLEE